MRLNWETALIGEKVILVPYHKKYVAKYHEWMKDPYLQEMTASEPLSLDEEYEMQESWRDDDRKCTFIVLYKSAPGAETFEISAMAGDVNLFLNDPEGDLSIAEIDVMIAEASCRRKGFGREAVLTMMSYGIDTLKIRRFYCKINEDNVSSLSLFESLGYVPIAYVAAFREIELEFLVREEEGEDKEKEEDVGDGSCQLEGGGKGGAVREGGEGPGKWSQKLARLKAVINVGRVRYVDPDDEEEQENAR